MIERLSRLLGLQKQPIPQKAIYSVREAARRGELVLFYQPKVDMRNGTTIGVEALLRWQHPELGILTPGMFDLAMKTGADVVLDIGHWAVEKGVEQLSDWGKEGLFVPISVNVMASELMVGDFHEWLCGVFNKHPDVSPTLFELEIVESEILSNPWKIVDVVARCRTIGVKFALDDFGTGYSCLSHVKNIPADFVKIDKSFVENIVNSAKDRDLVRAIIALAQSFGCEVIAEGVETVDQGLVLLQLGCPIAQGYVIAKPMEADKFPEWVRRYKGMEKWENDHFEQLDQQFLFRLCQKHSSTSLAPQMST